MSHKANSQTKIVQELDEHSGIPEALFFRLHCFIATAGAGTLNTNIEHSNNHALRLSDPPRNPG